MTDISSLQKFLTEQPDRATITKMDAKPEYKVGKYHLGGATAAEEVAARSAEIKRRRNIKD